MVKEFGEGVDRMFREMEETGRPAPRLLQRAKRAHLRAKRVIFCDFRDFCVT